MPTQSSVEGRATRIAAAIVLLCAGLAVSACDHRAPVRKVHRPTAPAAADIGPLSSGVVAPGIVEPWGNEVRVAAKEAGWIAEIAVHEGQAVRAGDRLAILEDGAQRAAVEVATADVAELEALLERALRGATTEELDQVRAEQAEGTARAARAEAAARRLERLAEAGAAPRAETEDARHEAAAAAAAAAALDARYAGALRGNRTEDVTAARRRLDSARARLQEAAAALARRVVTAPADGTILWSRYRPGELFNAGSQPLFVLGDVSHLQVRVDVDEIDAQRIAVGDKATIRFAAAGIAREGSVVSTASRMGRKNLLVETPTARNDVRVREVLVEVAPDPALLPGLRVWVSIETPLAG